MPDSSHLLLQFEDFDCVEIKCIRNLFAAVLGKAIHDAFTTSQDSQYYVKTARYWLFGPQEPEASFSFAWICEQLDLDYKALQVTLKSYDTNPELKKERLGFLLA